MSALDTQESPGRKRLLYIVGIVVTALVLAGVIFGVAALSKPNSSVERGGPTPFDESSRLYDQGLAALQSGDASAAALLFERALAVDPSNARARDQLDEIAPATPGTTPVPPVETTGTPSTEPTPVADPDAGFTGPVDDLTTLLPADVPGYDLGLASALGSDATVAGEPTPSGPAGIRSILYSVRDFQTTDKAQSFVSSTTRSAFAQNGTDVTVGGVSGYFGTDGERFAAVAFSRGRFAFEVILTTDSGAPGTLMDAALTAAEAFPDSL